MRVLVKYPFYDTVCVDTFVRIDSLSTGTKLKVTLFCAGTNETITKYGLTTDTGAIINFQEWGDAKFTM